MANQDKPLLSAQVLMRDAELKKLVGYYRGTAEKIIKELSTATEFGLKRRTQILKQIDSELGKLDKKTQEWVQREVEIYYRENGEDGIKALKAAGFPVDSTFSQIDKEAVKTLATDLMNYYREAYSGVKRSAMGMLTEAARDQVQILLAEGRISGDTRREISDRIAGKLRDGIVALVDKGGRRWSFESYSNMLTRTMMVRTANTGMDNRLVQNGHDLTIVSDHAAECNLCRPWEGRVLSISGRHPKYPSVKEAEDAGLFHPNCRHRRLPYHEKLAEISYVYNPKTGRYIKP